MSLPNYLFFGLYLFFFTGNTCTIVPEDIVYYFYSLQNPNYPIEVPSINTSAINNTYFNASQKSLILVHGGGGNSFGPLTKTTKDTLFNASIDINVIALDWSSILKRYNKQTYRYCLTQFGKIVADFLNVMVDEYGLRYSDLTISGHSLAGRILGAIGLTLKGVVHSMVALDSDSIPPEAANFVQVRFFNFIFYE